MKSLVRVLNRWFIAAILTIFYFVVVGAARLIYLLFHLPWQQPAPNSYWQEIKYPDETRYFASPY